jgi:hypothetical protein
MEGYLSFCGCLVLLVAFKNLFCSAENELIKAGHWRMRFTLTQKLEMKSKTAVNVA